MFYNKKLLLHYYCSVIMLAVAATAFQPVVRSSVITRQSSHRLITTLSSSMVSDTGYERPVVQWYPGHIAKAERALAETLKAVDVVVEVRDARIPKATSHPMIAQWTAGRPRLVVLTHGDVIPGAAKADWISSFPKFGLNHPDQEVDLQAQNQNKQAQQERLKYADDRVSNPVLYVNAKQGIGVKALIRSITQAGAHVQERRKRRGLKERPLRVGVLGYPNVGKSALINKIIGRKRAKTSNLPGVTRSLQWIRVRTDKKESFELLDSPGIIPASLVDQSDATLLAACNCIGDAAYDNQAVASFLCDWMLRMHRHDDGQIARQYAPQWRAKCIDRYQFDPLSDTLRNLGEAAPRTGEDILFDVADGTCQGDPENAARKIIQDFRSGRMGPICLQVAPASETDKGHRQLDGFANGFDEEDLFRESIQLQLKEERDERARMAHVTAKEKGFELPPIIVEQQVEDENKAPVDNSQVGKGIFDGW